MKNLCANILLFSSVLMGRYASPALARNDDWLVLKPDGQVWQDVEHSVAYEREITTTQSLRDRVQLDKEKVRLLKQRATQEEILKREQKREFKKKKQAQRSEFELKKEQEKQKMALFLIEQERIKKEIQQYKKLQAFKRKRIKVEFEEWKKIEKLKNKQLDAIVKERQKVELKSRAIQQECATNMQKSLPSTAKPSEPGWTPLKASQDKSNIEAPGEKNKLLDMFV